MSMFTLLATALASPLHEIERPALSEAPPEQTQVHAVIAVDRRLVAWQLGEVRSALEFCRGELERRQRFEAEERDRPPTA